ncbi:MAG: RluA family pseudouridine synthase [Planctomycetota bacterium]|jgi:23S rRNA pseudouridine1911/1915/1917 synthase
MASTHPDAVDDSGHLDLRVGQGATGTRVDQFLGRALAPRWSRSYLSALIEQGTLTVDGRPVRPSFRVATGQRIEGDLGEPADSLPRPEPMDLSILHVDDSLIIVEKPAGLIIHPGSGSKRGTLVNGILAAYPEVATVGRADRPGVVHRLDRDTTGVLVMARTNEAARSLVNQFKQKTVEKEYTAVVWGEPPFDSDWIDLPLGAHPRRPASRAVVDEGQASSTFYKVERRLSALSVVNAQPRTGRTHQIRVHLEHIGFPIVCDAVYGRSAQVAYSRWVEGLRAAGAKVPTIARHALHARRIGFEHPGTGERVHYEAPLPADMAELIAIAEEQAA